MSEFLKWFKGEVSKLRALVEQLESNISPHDLASLILCAKEQEMRKEYSNLNNLLLESHDNTEVIKEGIIALCRKRFFQNQGTALSFSAFPEGYINKLYIEIVSKLFEPQDVDFHFSILFPGVEYVIRISDKDILPFEYQYATQKEKRAILNKSDPLIDKQYLTNIKIGKELSSAISKYVFCKNYVFDLSSIQYLQIEQQVKVYRKIKNEYPELYEKLYSYNKVLNHLQNDILIILNNGRTPRDALSSFLKCLTNSGTKTTGRECATSSAHEGLVAFHEYLENINEELKLNIKALVTSGGKTFSAIWDDLLDQSCVETESMRIHDILKNPENNRVLETPSNLSNELLKGIESKYKIKKDENNWLSFLEENNYILPNTFAEQTLGQIDINNTESLIVLLMNFYPYYYDKLFQSIKISNVQHVLVGLMEGLKLEMFTPEQSDFLIKALLKHIHRLISPAEILYIFQMSNNEVLVRDFLNSLTEEERITTLSHENAVLLSVVRNPVSFKVMLDLIPRNALLQLLNIRDEWGRNIFYYAVDYPDSLRALCKLTDDYFRYINEADLKGYSVIHHAYKLPNSLRYLLNLYSQIDRLELIMRVCLPVQISLLRLVIDEPNSLAVVLESVDESRRYQILKDASIYLNDVSYQAEYNDEVIRWLSRLTPQYQWAEVYIRNKILCNLDNPEVLETYLNTQDESDILNAITIRDYNNGEFLQRISNRPNILIMIIKSLSESKRTVVSDLISGYITKIIKIEYYNDSELMQLINLFQGANKLKIFLRKHTSDSVQNWAMDIDKPALIRILKCLPQNLRIDALLTKRSLINGPIIFDLLYPTPELLIPVLNLLDESDRLSAVTFEENGNYYSLIKKIRDSRVFMSILDVLPKFQRIEIFRERNSAYNWGIDKHSILLFNISLLKMSIEDILYKLPESDRFEFLTLPDINEDILWHDISNDFILTKRILQLLPEDKRFEAITFQKNGFASVLQRTVHLSALQLDLLKLLPEVRRVDALKTLSRSGNPIINEVSPIPSNLEKYLNLVPTMSRLELLLQVGKYSCILDRVANHPKSVKLILRLLDNDDQRLIAIRYMVKNAKGYRPFAILREIDSPLCQFLSILIENNRERTSFFVSSDIVAQSVEDLVSVDSTSEIVHKVLKMFDAKTMQAEILLNAYYKFYFKESLPKLEAYENKIIRLLEQWKLDGLLEINHEYSVKKRKRKHEDTESVFIPHNTKKRCLESKAVKKTSRKRTHDDDKSQLEPPKKMHKRLGARKRVLEEDINRKTTPSKKIKLPDGMALRLGL